MPWDFGSINEVKADDKLIKQELQVWHGCLDDRVQGICTMKFSEDATHDPFCTNVIIHGRPELTKQLIACMRQQYGARPCHPQAVSVSSHFKDFEQLLAVSPAASMMTTYAAGHDAAGHELNPSMRLSAIVAKENPLMDTTESLCEIDSGCSEIGAMNNE
jgi:hypothetical protein